MSVVPSIGGIGSGLLVLIAIPMLINCFFGYKIQKFLITLGGVGIGAILGALLGVLSRSGVIIFLSALILAVVGGFLAFKLYRFGIFMQFWLLGTLAFAVLFVVMGSWNLITFAIVLGLVVGILALVIHKGFVIITTAVSGGMVGGVCLGIALRSPVIGLVLGIVFSVCGILVQFYLEKKEKAVNQVGTNGVVQVQVSVNQPTIPYGAPQVSNVTPIQTEEQSQSNNATDES